MELYASPVWGIAVLGIEKSMGNSGSIRISSAARALFISAVLLATASTSMGEVAYQSDFTIATDPADLASAGLVKSAGAASGSWRINTTVDFLDGLNISNARSNVSTIDAWQNGSGFTLNVTFRTTSGMTRFSFGLVDAAYTISASGDWLNSDLPGAYGIGFSTAGSGSSDFLGFNSDAGVRTVLSQAQGDATVGTGWQTLSITVTATNWSYSLNGSPPTTGTFADSGLPDFDLSRYYRWTAHAHNNAYADFSNITLSTDVAIPTLSEWGMIILFAGLVVLGYRKLKARTATSSAGL